MNTVSPQLYEIFEEPEKNDVVDSRSFRSLLAAWHSHVTHIGRIETLSDYNRKKYSNSENNYGTQYHLKITSGPNIKLTGGLKWNR